MWYTQCLFIMEEFLCLCVCEIKNNNKIDTWKNNTFDVYVCVLELCFRYEFLFFFLLFNCHSCCWFYEWNFLVLTNFIVILFLWSFNDNMFVLDHSFMVSIIVGGEKKLLKICCNVATTLYEYLKENWWPSTQRWFQLFFSLSSSGIWFPSFIQFLFLLLF